MVDHTPARDVVRGTPCGDVELGEYLAQILREHILAVGIYLSLGAYHDNHRHLSVEAYAALVLLRGVERAKGIGCIHRLTCEFVGDAVRHSVVPRLDGPLRGIDPVGVGLNVGCGKIAAVGALLLVDGGVVDGVIDNIFEATPHKTCSKGGADDYQCAFHISIVSKFRITPLSRDPARGVLSVAPAPAAARGRTPSGA